MASLYFASKSLNQPNTHPELPFYSSHWFQNLDTTQKDLEGNKSISFIVWSNHNWLILTPFITHFLLAIPFGRLLNILDCCLMPLYIFIYFLFYFILDIIGQMVDLYERSYGRSPSPPSSSTTSAIPASSSTAEGSKSDSSNPWIFLSSQVSICCTFINHAR